jgi:hypothetical protein
MELEGLTPEQATMLRSIVLARGDLLARRWLESEGIEPSRARELARAAGDFRFGYVRPLADLFWVGLFVAISAILPNPLAFRDEWAGIDFLGMTMPLWTLIGLPFALFFGGRALFVLIEQRLFLAGHPPPPNSSMFRAALTERGTIERVKD